MRCCVQDPSEVTQVLIGFVRRLREESSTKGSYSHTYAQSL